MNNRFLKALASALTAVITVISIVFSALPAEAAALNGEAITAPPRLVVDMLDDQGEIMHGASGFLYGISSEGVPENSLIVPLKPKVLASKGALGTEHPYGDALDVAESFFMSGGEMVQMYCSNYYAIFGPVATNVQYAKDLKDIIAPAVVKWKNEWKDRHGTPDNYKDELGKIDIDKAIVYLPINEGSPQIDAETGTSDNHQSFYQSWKLYYDAIKEADPKATIGGPNDAAYGHWRPGGMEEFLEFCAKNDCWPDVQTWHQLDDGEEAFERYPNEIAEYRSLAKKLKMPESTIVINEYATMEGCGVPGILIRYIANMEENKVYACLPFWHQANNLNDLAADANEPNSAWWFYKWYAEMNGKLLSTSKENTTAVGLSGIASIDSEKATASVLFGGADGRSTIVLKDLAKADGFKDVKKVNVKLQAAHFKGFLGAAEPETLMEGVFELDGEHLVIDIDDMISSSGYSMVVTPAEDDAEAVALKSGYSKLYEAEKAELSGRAGVNGSGGYYASGRAFVSGFSKESGVSFKINVPADGNYKLELVYGNGTGTDRGNEDKHSPQNVFATLSIDSEEKTIVLENTMLREWSDIYTELCDLTAGEHTVKLTGISDSTDNNIMLDALYVTYNGAYLQEPPRFSKLFEAEDAMFNQLASVKKTAVKVESDVNGFTGRGYITGLDTNPVSDGGGIRFAVNVYESGLYRIDLRYIAQSAAKAEIYVGNTARTFDGFKTEISLEKSDFWSEASHAVYLQKGMNIVDIDSSGSIMLDSVRISELPDSTGYMTTINAKDTIPDGAELSDVSYYVWKVKADENGEPELYKEYRSTDKIGVTGVPEGVEYVVGRSLSGSADAANDVNRYLEFEYTAPESGVYALRIFHSNDEIFGTHGYNTKIIDKYLSVQVNGGEAKRYFFINSLSKDTFKEKTVYITLEKGVNKIKLFNDDSWSVLKGLDNNYAEQAGLKKSIIGDSEQGYYMDKPGDIPITNSMPNILKFVIAPAQADVDYSHTEHNVSVKYSDGGTAFADKNSVEDNGSVTFTVIAEREIKSAAFNGEKISLSAKNSGVYTFTANNVNSDSEFIVEFERNETEAENSDPLISNNSFGAGNADGWRIETKGKASVESAYFDRYSNKNYLKIACKGSTSVANTVTVDESGVYLLSFAMKNKGYSSSEMKKCDSIELVASVDGKKNAQIFVLPSEEYGIVSCLINIPKDGAVLDFALNIKAKGGFEAYLDDFTLTKRDIVRDTVIYLVDCGDHNPRTRPTGGRLGGNNSVTDMLFGEDPKTGKQWGAVDYSDPDGSKLNYSGDSEGAFTKWTRPYIGNGTEDTKDTNATFRYADGQDGSDEILKEIGEIYVDYKFELEPDELYDVEVGLGNIWGNSSGVNVYANYLSEVQLKNGNKSQSQAFSVIKENVFVAEGGHTVVTDTVAADSDGFLTINLRRPLPAENSTINLNYIIIRRSRTVAEYKDSISELTGDIEKLDRKKLSKALATALDESRALSDEVLTMDISGDDIVVLTNAETSLKNLIAAAEVDVGDEPLNLKLIAIILAAVVIAGVILLIIVRRAALRKKHK